MLPIASGNAGAAPNQIHQDITLYASFFTENHAQQLEIPIGRQSYPALMEGEPAQRRIAESTGYRRNSLRRASNKSKKAGAFSLF